MQDKASELLELERMRDNVKKYILEKQEKGEKVSDVLLRYSEGKPLYDANPDLETDAYVNFAVLDAFDENWGFLNKDLK